MHWYKLLILLNVKRKQPKLLATCHFQFFRFMLTNACVVKFCFSDIESPIVECPENVEIIANPFRTTTEVSWVAANASDNSDNVSFVLSRVNCIRSSMGCNFDKAF